MARGWAGSSRAVRAALETRRVRGARDGRFRAAGHELGPEDVLVELRGREGWSVAADDGLTVALDTRLDPELELEGRVLDLIHHVNTLRKQQGFELTDRIVLTLPAGQADVLDHEDWIKRETLAVRVETDSVESPEIMKA